MGDLGLNKEREKGCSNFMMVTIESFKYGYLFKKGW